MAYQAIGLGSAANDGTGDDLRAAGTKVNANFVELYAAVGAAAIKTAYESNADTNAFTDAEKTKLGTVESGATADQTGAEIKASYEAEADTNAFDDAAVAKLAGIEAGATASSGDFLADGTVAMTGAFDTDVGTFSSSVASGASNVSYALDTSGAITDAGHRLASVRNNGTEMFGVEAVNGDIHLSAGTTPLIKGATNVVVVPTFNFGSALGNTTVSIGSDQALGSTRWLGWSNISRAIVSTGICDTRLYRDAAGVLALQAGTTQQEFRVYETYTDASNYSRVSLAYDSGDNALELITEAAGTGTRRDVRLNGANRAAYNASPTTTDIRDILIDHGLMAAS